MNSAATPATSPLFSSAGIAGNVGPTRSCCALPSGRALQLKESGVRTGDRVLLCGPNSAEWVAAFWGCLMRGAVVVALDDSSTPEFVARVAADSGVKAAFLSRSKFAADPLPCPPFSWRIFPAPRRSQSSCPLAPTRGLMLVPPLLPSPTNRSPAITSRKSCSLPAPPMSRAGLC